LDHVVELRLVLVNVPLGDECGAGLTGPFVNVQKVHRRYAQRAKLQELEDAGF
jgi:hypothetical protein